MRVTIAFLLATVLVIALAVIYVNNRANDAAHEQAPPLADDRAVETVRAVPFADRQIPPARNNEPLFVSACIDSGDHCRCYDKQSKDLELAQVDCKAMLKLTH
jgi:hypothetical protein